MRPFLPFLFLAWMGTGVAQGQGLLIPTQRDVPPLALVSHEVKIALEDQVAVTKVVQTFRNHSSQALEATYVFPVPKGASVKKFTMWVDGKEVPGELVEADKARTIYNDIVRRTQDPGLLEYLGNNLLRVRVFPVPAHGEQKLAVNYTSLAPSDNGLVEYIYPLKAEGKKAGAVEKFTLEASLKTQEPLQNIYSPTHAIQVRRPNDREAVVHFEGKQETLDKDFQLYYTSAAKDVGLTALVHRPQRTSDGHFMLLISPRAELSQTQQVPRDMVFVLDTSGSMQGKRILQAKNALKHCLRNLSDTDRFGLIHFATGATKFKSDLLPASAKNLLQAQTWVEGLGAVGSTNIDEALATALAMRSSDANRTLTIVFFTDGQPTVGETNPETIVRNVAAKNTANTRIFTFGVGDDVNAVLLDQLADKTRSVSSYVRESEDIEAKVSGLYNKISHPVLSNLKLSVGPNVTISEVYPPQLPDLFHGSQLVVLGRYQGKGSVPVTLAGMVGTEKKEFQHSVHFPNHTKTDKTFVEDLWARRKVGYLLDQIRVNGESKEVKDEVLGLAKRYGITTPYTSYLVVPDVAPNVAGGYQNHGYQINPGNNGIQFAPIFVSPSMNWSVPSPTNGLPSVQPTFDSSAATAGPVPPPPTRGWVNSKFGLVTPPAVPGGNNNLWGMFRNANSPTSNPELSAEEIKKGLDSFSNGSFSSATAQSGKQGVDLSQQLAELRNQDRLAHAAVRQAAGRKCYEMNGVWVDEGADVKMPVVKIKAQSDAYFRMLERQPQMREVFQLGNRLVWVTPSQTVLVVDSATGQEQMNDVDMDRLFVVKK